MKQIDEILRLRHEMKYSHRQIADATHIPRSTIRDYLMRANAANLTWPLPEGTTNDELNKLLFPVREGTNKASRPVPDWSVIHKELKRKSMTLQLLWEEYKKSSPNGYQYSWFANSYRQWAKSHDVWMPQVHKSGEKAFVDFSGLKVPIYSTNLQEVEFEAEIFVSVLGASDLIFCFATQTQQIPDWIDAHNKMLHYYGGVPELIVPDNLKTGVTRPHRYEPSCQATYEELGRHYNCAIMPARSYKPRDKAKVEKAVQLVQQRILATLRHERFSSVNQLNKKIMEQLELLNNRHSKSFGCSRWELFSQIERSTLRPLPNAPYELGLWSTQKVNGGYHVLVNQHYYSVPHQFVTKKVDIRTSKDSVEIFYADERIACHVRDDSPRGYTTVELHRPEAHRQQAMWNKEKLQAWASGIGTATEQFIKNLFLDEGRHLYQKEKSALGILRLSNAYSESALEIACKKALSLGTYRFDSVESILKRKGKELDIDSFEQNYGSPHHENVRGSQYYH